MKHLTFSHQAKVYKNAMEAGNTVQLMSERATDSCAVAYAPYSGFKVGAIIKLENGEMVSGSNQENAAYPSGLCAERVAVFSAGSSFPGIKMTEIFIQIDPGPGRLGFPAAPCGACRQVMLEYEEKQGAPLKIYCRGTGPEVLCFESVNELLPFSFGKTHLNLSHSA